MRTDPVYDIDLSNQVGGVTNVDDCYTVIEKILAPFNCRIMQYGGYWVIENPQELDSQEFFFSAYYDDTDNFRTGGSGTTEYSNSPQPINNILSIVDSNFEPFGKLSKIPPKKEEITTFMQRRIGDRIAGWDSWDQGVSDPDWNLITLSDTDIEYTVNESSDHILDFNASTPIPD